MNYYVADYEVKTDTPSSYRLLADFELTLPQNPISPEILRVVASRVIANDRNDHRLLPPETEEVGAYESPLPREVSGLETYVPAYLTVPHLRRVAARVAEPPCTDL